MIVKIGDRKIDASVASRLGKLERVLSQRASQELHGKADYVVGTAA
ncbi:MAG: hypothetical protein ACE5HE_12845 [Phycisphaerae bacterium]